jgi:hypothetical protein
MRWKDIIKADPCTVETREFLYDVLKKMGANNDLLDTIQDSPSEELRDTLEHFSNSSPNEVDKEVFKKILESWDVCLNRTDFSREFQTKLASEDIMKSKKIVLPLFKEAINEATSGESQVFNDIELHEKIKDIYKNKLIENDYNLNFIAMHLRYKLVTSKMKPAVGRVLKTLGWESFQVMNYGSTGTKVWRR